MNSAGLLFEERFFGKSSKGIDGFKKKKFMSFQDCLDFVRRNQTLQQWNSRMPRTVLSQTLFNEVACCLPEKHRSGLLLYSAIGTPLDVYYGIDGFFCLAVRYEKIVSFDLTTSKNLVKRIRQKADFLISPKDLEVKGTLGIVGMNIAGRLSWGLKPA